MSIVASNFEVMATEIVDEVTPAEGWWKSDTEGTLIDVAMRLLAHDVPVDDVTDAIQKVVSAMRGEYGE